MNTGILLMVPGALLAFAAFCITTTTLFPDSGDLPYMPPENNVLQQIILMQTLAILTLGVGITIFWQAQQSLKGSPSGALRLSSVGMMWIFVALLLAGFLFSRSGHAAGLFFPPILLLLAALPPLWAVSWFTPRDKASAGRLTWRRGLVAFCGGATLSVLLALVLEILIPIVILLLTYNVTHSVLDHLGDLFNDGSSIGRVLSDPAFVYLFIQLAVIAPVVEELVKPLVTLPLLRNLNRQETFWVGALAGAGFAAVENVIYAGSGLSIWAGILVVRALGAALHPLGSGWVALGWRDVLRGEPNALEKWFKHYGLAVLTHAIWNGGSLLIITLGGAQIFGVLPPQIGILGLSMSGVMLAFLLLMGIAALGVGRAFGQDRPLLAAPETDGAARAAAPSERVMALWALACLLAIVPMGIMGLRLWLP